MKSRYALLAALAAVSVLVCQPANAFVVKSDGPVIEHKCGLKSDPTGCHWCTATGCYIVTDCHNGSCTIAKHPLPSKTEGNGSGGNTTSGGNAAPIKTGKPVQAN
jgi:hypothetical protein